MRKKNAAFCREMAARLHVSLGLPKEDGHVLASLLLNGGAATLSDVADVAGVSLGAADAGCASLTRRGAVWESAGLKPGTWTYRRNAGLRGALPRLRQAYQSGGLEAVREEHVRTSERSGAYRRVGGAMEGLCPVRGLLRLGAALDDALTSKSLPKAATAILSRLPDRWEVPMGDGTRALLQKKPLLIYGNHPSMLTPFLVAAALERDDVKILAHRYVTTLVPGMSDYVLPLEPTHLVKAQRRGFASPGFAVSLSALRRLDRAVDAEEARRENRASLDLGVEHVQAGGALAIFPNGGREGKRWYPGLGRLVTALCESGALLVPVHESGSSNRRLYRALRGRRRLGSSRHPIRFYVGQPLPIERLSLPADVSPLEVSALLQRLYEKCAWPAIERYTALRRSPTAKRPGRPARSRFPRSAILLPNRG